MGAGSAGASAAAAYIIPMSTWTETEHPRNRTGNFAEKVSSAPDATLPGDGLTYSVSAARRAEAAAKRAADRKFMNDLQFATNLQKRRYRYDDASKWEEVAQNAALALISQRAKGTIGAIADNGGLISAAVSTAAYSMMDGTRNEDTFARALLRDAREAETLRLDRDLTSAEMATMADHVRMTMFEPQHRPTPDYHLYERRTASIDELDENGNALVDLYSVVTLPSPFSTDTSHLADVLDGLPVLLDHRTGQRRVEPELTTAAALDADGMPIPATTIGRMSASNVRRDLWNHLAEDYDIPQVNPGRFEKKHIDAIATVVNGYPGGVTGLCADWSADTAPPEATKALFAPFGNPGFEDEEKIVDRLLAFPQLTEQLFLSALAISKTRVKTYDSGQQEIGVVAG